jgi:CDP-4-dehydro-6-deoxyglucose reductase, E1
MLLINIAYLMPNTTQDKIKDLVESISDDKKSLRYIYNSNKDFIPGTTPVYYSGPYWDNREIEKALESFLTGKWLSAGESVNKFEARFSKMFNMESSVMVNSGSSANLVMIAAIKKVLKWEDGSEIILSPVGFPTTIAPVVQSNLKPVFIDIEMDTLNFDLNLIEAKITDKTKAIFVSPVLGNPPDMDKLCKIAEKYNLEIILDNCDSLGSKWRGKYLTDYAIAASCSFYPAHHISTGEGGMVSSNNSEIVNIARSLAWWGRDCYCVGAANLLACGTCGNRFDKWLDKYDGIVDHKYIFANMGYNLKPLDMQGAIGLIQLTKWEEIHANRVNSKNKLQDIIMKYLPEVHMPEELPNAETSWFGTPIVCKGKTQKDWLVGFLESIKVQTRNYFAGNILLHPGYSHLDDYKNYPNSNEVLNRVFFIGASPHYTNEIFNYIDTELTNAIH